MPSTTKSGSQKVNKGGRPRKNASSRGPPGIQWKIIQSPPGSLNHYEISSQGEVRRKLKDGRYSPVKPWVTGGPYAAVYLYGFPNVTRNRKKVYIHRLVAEHFVKGRKPGEVVHHKQGPANNSASALEWVSVDENAKAKKYFHSDGSRKSKKKLRVPAPNALKNTGDLKAPSPKKPVKPKPVAKKQDNQKVVVPPPKPKPAAVKSPPPKPKPLPGKADDFPDQDEYIPNVDTDKQKIRYLTKRSPEVARAYKETRKVITELSSSKLPELFRKATGKKLKLDDNRSPSHWKIVLLSALQAIRTRLVR